jgi:hypothetical protein
MEISEVRRRLRAALDDARRRAGERRALSDAAVGDYEAFLANRAVPVFRQVALALGSEGRPFAVHTPAGSVRLASERSAEDFVEVVLDDTGDRPVVLGRASRGRGRRQVSTERPLRDDVPIADLSDEDVLTFVLESVVPMVQS